MTDDGGIRASDADREHVVEILREAYSAGRLTLEEFDERTTSAFAAKTWGGLRALTRDLPQQARLEVEAAQVDDGELLDPQAGEVVFDGGPEFARLLGWLQRDGGVNAVRSDLADEHDVVGVGRERAPDQLVGQAGTVKLRRVEVVDAQLDGAAEQGDRFVCRERSPARPLGELHDAVAHPGDRPAREEGLTAGRGWLVREVRHRGGPLL